MAVSLFNISSPPGGQHGGVVKHVNFLDCLDWHGDHRLSPFLLNGLLEQISSV